MSALAELDTIRVEHCDHCGCGRLSTALDASPWTLVECDECGFVFTSPRLTDKSLLQIYSAEYYEAADTYAAQQIQPPSEDHLELAQRAMRILRKRTSGRLSSVDVGCGGGRLTEAFTQAGFAASGIEPSDSTVRAAQAAGRNVIVADVADLSDQSYDSVTAMHVLEHVTSPSEFMAHLFRITKPGGLCVIEVPNYASRASRTQGADWYALHPSTHLSHFTPGSLAACMTKAGFSVTSLHRLGGAGVFADVSSSTASKTKKSNDASTQERKLRTRALATVWKLRSTVLSIRRVRNAARWVNWELLGHGEFVRAFACRPRS